MPAALQWTSEELHDMVTSYGQGESAQSIAKRYGTSYQVIQPLLARQGVKLRSKREANKKQHCDEHYFRVIDSEEKAYWLGFLTADGCVTAGKKPGDSPRISLHLARQDYGHLMKLKKALRASQMISVNARSCSLTIFSAEMAADLARHGVRPNKTFSTKPAQIAIDLERHYWRGVIDGDGNFARGGDLLKLVGDYDVVLAFQGFVFAYCPKVTANIRKRENIFTFTIRRQATRRILQTLYEGATVSLDRKYRRAHAILTDAVEET
jgi:helix-turn-helix protein